MKTAHFLTGLLLAAAFVLGGCANPAPVEADPVDLPSLGFEAVRIMTEGGVLF